MTTKLTKRQHKIVDKIDDLLKQVEVLVAKGHRAEARTILDQIDRIIIKQFGIDLVKGLRRTLTLGKLEKTTLTASLAL